MECKRCGECCVRMIIEIDQDDLDREPLLAEYVQPIRNPYTGVEDGVGWGYDMTQVGGCPMLDEKTRECLIWETRPKVCRRFEAGGNQCRWMRDEVSLEALREVRDQARASGAPMDVTGVRSYFL